MVISKCEGISWEDVSVVAENIENVIKDVEFCHHTSAFLLVLVGQDEDQAILRRSVIRYHRHHLIGK